MAVYTTLEKEEIEQFIQPFGLGPLVSYEGVADGIENTNYFIRTDESAQLSEEYTEPVCEFVLTIFETLSAQELQFYVDFTTMLNLRGLPAPSPLTDANGVAMQTLHQKPALLIPKIDGQHPDHPTKEQCQAIGKALAELHQASTEAAMSHDSQRDYSWLRTTAKELLPGLDKDDAELMQKELQNLDAIETHDALPKAVIHSDLFRDNTLFDDQQLKAVIDFYSAGNGHLIMDLAVTVNDWCSNDDGSLNEELTHDLVIAYTQVRQPDAEEALLWNNFLRLAALRFWVSRLLAHQTHRPGGLTEQKDPNQYKAILLSRINKHQDFPH
jgi:homoserine kinase type II